MSETNAPAARCGQSARPLRTGLAAGCLLASFAGAAHARVEVVRWQQPGADVVEGFNVHVGTEPGSYQEAIDVGSPTASADGVYAFLLSVPDASEVYVAVSAYNGAGASARSNEVFRGADAASRGGADALADEASGGTGDGAGAASGARGRRRGDGALRIPARGRLALAWSEPAELHASLDPRSVPESEGLELRGRLRVDAEGGGIGLTLRDPADGDAFYWLARDPEPGAPFTIASTVSTLQCADALPVPEAGAWYRVRLALRPEAAETLVAAKVWRQGTREPRQWTGCLDASGGRLVAAVPGVWAAGEGVKAWERIKVTRPPG